MRETAFTSFDDIKVVGEEFVDVKNVVVVVIASFVLNVLEFSRLVKNEPLRGHMESTQSLQVRSECRSGSPFRL